jgi:hypothetical protein
MIPVEYTSKNRVDCLVLFFFWYLTIAFVWLINDIEYQLSWLSL